jgi:O-antigen/teichoic acid export membrane protein
MNNIFLFLKINSLISQGLFILNVLLRLFITPLLISNYSSEIIGLYFLAFNISSYFMFFDFGLGRTLTYELISSDDLVNKKKLFNSSLLFYILFSLILILGISIFFFIYNPSFTFINNYDLSIIVFSSILNISFLLTIQSYNALLESFGVQYKLNLLKSILSFFSVVVLALMILNKLEIYYLFIFQSFVSFITFLLIAIYVKNKFDFSFSFDDINKLFLNLIYLLKKGWKIMLNNIIASVYTLMDVTMIPLYFGINFVTAYAVSSNTSRYVHSFSSTILSPIHTLYSKVLNSKNIDYLLINKLGRLSFLISSSLGFLLFVFSDFLISIWIGDEFAKETDIIFKLLILSWTYHAISIPSFQFLEAKRMEIKNFYGSLFLTCITFFGIVIGIYYSKLEYFALFRLLASLTFNLFLFYNYSKFIKGSYLKHLLKLSVLTMLILIVYLLKNYSEQFFDKITFNLISILFFSLVFFYFIYKAYLPFSLQLKK